VQILIPQGASHDCASCFSEKKKILFQIFAFTNLSWQIGVQIMKTHVTLFSDKNLTRSSKTIRDVGAIVSPFLTFWHVGKSWHARRHFFATDRVL